MLRLICGNAPEKLKKFGRKQSFYDELKCEWDMHSVGDVAM